MEPVDAWLLLWGDDEQQQQQQEAERIWFEVSIPFWNCALVLNTCLLKSNVTWSLCRGSSPHLLANPPPSSELFLTSKCLFQDPSQRKWEAPSSQDVDLDQAPAKAPVEAVERDIHDAEEAVLLGVDPNRAGRAEDTYTQLEHTPLLWGAAYVSEHFKRGSGKYVQANVVRTVAMDRVHAAAERSLVTQDTALQEMLTIVRARRDAGIWRPVAAIEHILYDETEVTIRASFGDETIQGQDKQKGKVFVLERSFSLLIQRLPLVASEEKKNLRPTKDDFFLLDVYQSPRLRVAAATAGEEIFAVLQSATPLPSALADLFVQQIRVIESDEHGGNLRAENMLRSRRGAHWQHLQLLCLCHKRMQQHSKLGL